MKTSKISLYLLFISLSVLAASCGSTLRVTNDYDRNTNFSTYKTFSIYSVKTTGSVSQLNADRIVSAIKAEMTSKGYSYVESHGDLTINAITILKDKQSVSASTNYYGYGGLYRPYGYYGGMGMDMYYNDPTFDCGCNCKEIFKENLFRNNRLIGGCMHRSSCPCFCFKDGWE